MGKRYEAVVIGASAGGPEALRIVLTALPEDFSAPIMVVQHISPHSRNYMARHLDNLCRITVKEADEKEKIAPGVVYIAPPDYHLLVEEDRTLSLSMEDRVNYARPAADVLFETASEAYGDKLVGVVLTGANRDGSMGLRKIRENGGLTIVQSPETAVSDEMPRAAIAATAVDRILPPEAIGPFLHTLFGSH